MTTPDPKAVDTEVRRMFGEVAAFLSHPELGPILRRAAKEGWDSSRLFGALQQTKFWRTTGEDARKWSILRTLDPATAKARVDQQAQAVIDLSRQLGFTFPIADLRKIAEDSLAGGWSTPQIAERLRARAAGGAKESGSLDTAVAQQYGYLAAFLDDPVVGDLLRRGAREGWSAERLEIELRKTDWWKTTTESQRKWDSLTEQSPQDADAQRSARFEEIRLIAQQSGVRLNDTRLAELAEDSLRFGWSQVQVKNAIVREYEYGGGTQAAPPGTPAAETVGGRGASPIDRGRDRAREGAGVGPDAGTVVTPNEGEEFGFAGETARKIRELAGAYLVPMSEQAMERWTEQIVRGDTDIEGFNSYLVEQAKSMFPGMSGALDRGVTVAQYADPYRQIAARELELNPESIDLNDPRFRAMLDQKDSKGNRVSMTLSESAEYLRRLPEWQQTRGANEKAAKLTESILRTFGAVA